MPKIPFLFFRFLVSKMLVSILFSAFTVFFLWEIVETYHSVFLAGLVATIYLVVQMLVSVPVGHMIDRMNSTVIGMIGSVIVLLSPLLLTTGYTASGCVLLNCVNHGWVDNERGQFFCNDQEASERGSVHGIKFL
jgi:MFS family permease